jgi:peptide/nickel transport system substrate-binding protein
MVEISNLIILFQPIYQTVVRNTVKTFPLTAAGYQVELENARP